jgi:recombination protein RecA
MMFSMSFSRSAAMVVPDGVLRKVGLRGVSLGQPQENEARAKALPLGVRGIDEALPEAGLPRGAVVEMATPGGLARATSLALAVCASAQNEARQKGGAGTDGAWCAFIDPAGTLFAPAVARAGVDLARLLVVRPPLGDDSPPNLLARVAVRVAASGVFSAVVVDLAGVPGGRLRVQLDRWVTAVRRLALAVEKSETTVLLLTDLLAPRSLPLPVAMRLEVERPSEPKLLFRVAKDRRGQVTAPWSVDVRESA